MGSSLGAGCREPLETLSYGHEAAQVPHPAERFRVPSLEIVGMTYEGLTRLTPSGTFEPGVAASWDVSPDGTVYRFRIRPGVRFHSGTPLVAADARQSLLSMLETTEGPFRDAFRVIRDTEFPTSAGAPAISAPDDSTLVIRLRRPFAPLPWLLAHPLAAIRRLRPDGSPEGTGPWVPGELRGEDLELRRNDDYWEGPALEDRLFIHLLNLEASLDAYDRGTVGVTLVPFAQTSAMVRRWPREIERGPAERIELVVMNTRRGPLRDPRVRHAINHATNVGAMLRTVMQERGHVAPGPVPPGWEGHDFNQAPFPFAPDHAARLLVDADRPGGGFAISIWFDSTKQRHAQVVDAMQWDLGRLGIEVRPVPETAETVGHASIQGEADLIIVEWTAPYTGSSAMLRPLFHSASSPVDGNVSFLADPRLDSLIDRAEGASNPTLRAELYRAANHRVLEMAPAVFLWFPEDVWLVRPEIVGWERPVMPGAQRWHRVRRR